MFGGRTNKTQVAAAKLTQQQKHEAQQQLLYKKQKEQELRRGNNSSSSAATFSAATQAQPKYRYPQPPARISPARVTPERQLRYVSGRTLKPTPVPGAPSSNTQQQPSYTQQR